MSKRLNFSRAGLNIASNFTFELFLGRQMLYSSMVNNYFTFLLKYSYSLNKLACNFKLLEKKLL